MKRNLFKLRARQQLAITHISLADYIRSVFKFFLKRDQLVWIRIQVVMCCQYCRIRQGDRKKGKEKLRRRSRQWKHFARFCCACLYC